MTETPPSARKDPNQISTRERVFYDQKWSDWTPTIIREPLNMYGAVDLAGKKILICACGTGGEAVRAARAGAEVYAFDISPVAVERTRLLASFNEVEVNASVMDFHHLGYPDDFFDVAYGEQILHHIDCGLAGKELYRVLRQGGIARFLENSDANPLIMWFRRVVFGRTGTSHKQRVWFINRIGSADEDPLTAAEVATLGRIFGGNITVGRPGFMFFTLISKHLWNHPSFAKMTHWLDRCVKFVAPSLTKYSFMQTIWLRKISSP